MKVILRKTAKITNTQLGELCRKELVVRVDNEHYKLTTFGIVKLQKEALPAVKSRG
ncbi:MAG: hypothetical protein JSV58_06745 [Candidatus Bathyarchaeota archaeon]|nr:MAG: hypothetical protein JSV58_06745 [Candidatus Bathyarchaeota archaeon]